MSNALDPVTSFPFHAVPSAESSTTDPGDADALATVNASQDPVVAALFELPEYAAMKPYEPAPSVPVGVSPGPSPS